MMGTQTALRMAKMMYVFQPMFWMAGGVIWTMRKLQIQLLAVETEEPRWRRRRGRISDLYHTERGYALERETREETQREE
jgi:hypothetical protein